MAFKMKSGNKVSFKNMGSSPIKQKPITLPSGATIEGLQMKKKDEDTLKYDKSKEVRGLEIKDKDTKKFGGKATTLDKDPKNLSTNKESKSKWDFDWMQLLDSFLTSGGGKGGLLKAAGSALSKKSPNELLAEDEARKVRKQKREENRKARLAKNINIEDQ